MTNSTRRSLLRYGAASGAAFLAGCLGDDPAATPGDADDGCDAEDVLTEGAEPSPSESGFPVVSAAADVASDSAELAATARCVRSFSTDAPAEIRVAVANLGDESVTLGFGAHQPLTQYEAVHEAEDAELYVIPSESENQGAYHEHDGSADGNDASAEPGCWRLDGWGYDSIANNVTLGPCDGVTGSYAVFAAANNDPCTPNGTYRVEERLVGPDNDTEADLSVSLTLDRADD